MAIIELADVCKSFRNLTILNHISVQFLPGKIYGIYGKNGSGKTVLLKCICGLISVTSGQVLFHGAELTQGHLEFGVAFDVSGFIPSMTGFKNLLYLARLRKRTSRDKVKEIMELVGLPPDNKQPVSQYSLGMIQRLNIAQAIMENPQVLILDEPLCGLDLVGLHVIGDILNTLRASDKIVIISSRNLETLSDYCDIIYELDKGKLTRL